MPPPPFEHSKSRIDKAGALLRASLGNLRPFDAEIEEAVGIVESFRLAHSTPMAATIGELTRIIDAGGHRAAVAHRLKRLPQILLKLSRRPSLRLSTLNDVAGCRVVAHVDVLDALLAGLRAASDVRDVDDYRSTPKPSGYRAVHVVLGVDGRRVEVQLRSHTENAWAAWIEDLDRQPHLHGIKDGRGDDDVLELVSVVSRDLAEGTISAEDFHAYRSELEELLR